ncbi:MAG: phosphate ABC transporter permease PstA [Bdellovibrionota bacterium]
MRKLWRSGDPFIWLTGGALALSLLMVFLLVGLIVASGLGIFWPKDIHRFQLADGREIVGELIEQEEIPDPDAPPGTPAKHRIKVKQANRDLYGMDFLWIDEADIKAQEIAAGAVQIERREWGNFIGFAKEFRDGETVLQGAENALEGARKRLPEIHELHGRISGIEKDEIGALSRQEEEARLRLKGLERRGVKEGPEVEALHDQIEKLHGEYARYQEELSDLRAQMTGSLVLSAAGGMEKEVPLSQIVRVFQPNEMGLFGRIWFYATKVREFFFDDPREANTEGGIFPAIFGTIVMVLLMSVLVTPLGVLAAFYLREYAKQGAFTSAVRIAVNNLAGVPSIVFGVFGVGFLIYFVGGTIDKIFFADALPTPTFGTGGILWASITLALLTVPVVIVATEEGLAQIPTGMREGALALGATKFETTWRVVLPAVLPSMLTGMILAIARAAGEVAPLMITGVVKLAPSLPIDGQWPFLHLERKFMHLGFHIYDVGFQSPNVDAARPMVYVTTLLLLIIVVALNLLAISLRNRLRKKFKLSAV